MVPLGETRVPERSEERSALAGGAGPAIRIRPATAGGGERAKPDGRWKGPTPQGPDVDLLAHALAADHGAPLGGHRFPCSAVRSYVNRTLRAHECSLAFGIG